jgi:outer membrane protein
MILSALIAPALAFSQEGPRPISLPEAIQLAKKNAPSMIQARGTLRTNASALKVAKWAYFPLNQLTLGYSSSTSGGATIDQDGFLRQRPAGDWSFGQSFGGAQLTIWDGGTKIGNIKSARATITASEAAEVTAEFNITQQVKAQYYTILQQRETEANARTAMAQSENQLRIASAKIRNGTANILDSLTSVLAINNQQLAILTAQNAQNNASAQLTRLTASPFPVTAILSDTSDPPPLTMTDAELFALAENGPAVRQSAAQLRAAEIREKNSKAIYWPQITATGGYSRSNTDSRYDFGAGKMGYGWNFGLNASLQIFNGFARENTIISAKVATDNAEASLREQRLTVRQNLTQQIGTLRTAEEQLRIARLNLVVTQEALRVATARYENGVGLQDAVITAQQNLNTTRSTLTNARISMRNARAQIESIIGRDLPQ